MRALVIADAHANLAALEAVLADARARGGFDAVWCLGDVVGYGPQPRECIAVLRDLEALVIAGNHDLAAAGAVSADEFNPFARDAVLWTAEQLEPEERAWLRGLPLSLVQEQFTLVHGSLVDPVWDYLVSRDAAEAHFRQQQTPACLVGHSHYPIAFTREASGVEGHYLRHGDRLQAAGRKMVANPGSTGQPRDGDPRAAYAIAESDEISVHFFRVEYDVTATQRLMGAAGLPPPLIERLSIGR